MEPDGSLHVTSPTTCPSQLDEYSPLPPPPLPSPIIFPYQPSIHVSVLQHSLPFWFSTRTLKALLLPPHMPHALLISLPLICSLE